MTRRNFDTEGHAQFITFSCFTRRKLLDHDRCKKITIGMLGSNLKKRDGTCIGFVVMPDHVHTLVWFPKTQQVSDFMHDWKQQSSVEIRKAVLKWLPSYAENVADKDAIWQESFYPFNVFSEKKLLEKLRYMHENPVRAGLVEKAIDWPWSSARWYELGKSVGLPIGWVEP